MIAKRLRAYCTCALRRCVVTCGLVSPVVYLSNPSPRPRPILFLTALGHILPRLYCSFSHESRPVCNSLESLGFKFDITGNATTMCFSTLITWKRCRYSANVACRSAPSSANDSPGGHYCVRSEFCDEAINRTPPVFCDTAHEPRFVDVDESNGVCPDQDKHPPAQAGATLSSLWSLSLGITTTSGQGNEWYRRNQGQS